MDVIDNPHNRQVILGLLAAFGLSTQPWEKERYGVPRFSTEFRLDGLRTHPDLGGAMEAAAQGLAYTGGLILGYHVLVNQAGIIFAVAMSMTFLAVRLPPERETARYDPGQGGPSLDFGPGWVTADPWDANSLRPWMVTALAYADQLAAAAAA